MTSASLGATGGARTVVHVALTLRTGGLEKLLVQFARHHDRRRFVPVFIALRDAGPPAEEIRDQGCVVHVLGPPRGKWDEVRRLQRLFATLAPAVVHTHNVHPHFYGSIAARLARVPAVVHTRHGVAFGDNKGQGRRLFWLACRLADRVASVSEDAARLSAREGGLRAGKGLTIWNGIDVQAFAFRGPAPDGDLVTVSRLEPVKDLTTLLKAMAIAQRARPALRLRVVGDGSERPNLERLARSLGLEDAVSFLGERRDVAEILSTAGAFVSSSTTEGVSLTLLEAMAVGLPVVATAVGGNPEVAVQGVTAVLVPPGDPEALASAIVATAGDPARAAEMGRAARARVESRFDVRQMVRAYEGVYEEILGAARS
jgi:sugar transferase (PEP-CTERM/EpsH1 system associated)